MNMATAANSTSLGECEVTPDVKSAPNASTHVQNHVASGAGQETLKIITLDIEGEIFDETEYPTGIKFAMIILAIGLCLVLVGLVCSDTLLFVPRTVCLSD